MLEKAPTLKEIESYLGTDTISAWKELIGFIESNYNFDPAWDEGGKYGVWEVKYRRSGKTLCALYVKEKVLCVLIVFGKSEREKFELAQQEFSNEIVELYESTHQYHDGKWLWINVSDMKLIDDIKRLIMIKKKPQI